jgi:hypothetical protein
MSNSDGHSPALRGLEEQLALLRLEPGPPDECFGDTAMAPVTTARPQMRASLGPTASRCSFCGDPEVGIAQAYRVTFAVGAMSR